MYENISEFIHTFEENKKKKKAKMIKGVDNFIQNDVE